MTYEKINFKDQSVENPRTYKVTNISTDVITLTDNFGTVTELGTPINATNMNHIEDGITGAYDYADSQITNILKTLYPIGSIYLSTNATCPLSAIFGTWELVSDGRALWGGDGTNGGTTIAAGLPNITGQSGGFTYESGAGTNGAITTVRTGGNTIKTADYTKAKGYISFDASNSNSIYGNSETVQPPAYVVNVFRRTA